MKIHHWIPLLIASAAFGLEQPEVIDEKTEPMESGTVHSLSIRNSAVKWDVKVANKVYSESGTRTGYIRIGKVSVLELIQEKGRGTETYFPSEDAILSKLSTSINGVTVTAYAVRDRKTMVPIAFIQLGDGGDLVSPSAQVYEELLNRWNGK